MFQDSAQALDALLKVLSGVAIAVASAWFTVRLSRQKFRTERWWEKKVLAYERVIEAFHKAKKFASEHIDAEHKGRDVPEDRKRELLLLSKEARDEILRASDVGSFVLSERAMGILARYEAETSSRPQYESWYEYLDADWSLTHGYMKEFIAEAHADLKR
jgi:hypothetical protein